MVEQVGSHLKQGHLANMVKLKMKRSKMEMVMLKLVGKRFGMAQGLLYIEEMAQHRQSLIWMVKTFHAQHLGY